MSAGRGRMEIEFDLPDMDNIPEQTWLAHFVQRVFKQARESGKVTLNGEHVPHITQLRNVSTRYTTQGTEPHER